MSKGESVGWATYSKPMRLWDKVSGNLTDFTTSFSFVIDSRGNSDYADGFSFFLAPADFPFPDVRFGGGLGLFDGIVTSFPFVAVEFDTFSNEWDPHGNHVGIDLNTMKSVKNVTWMSSVRDGRRNDARITYNSTTKNLSVAFTGFKGNNTIQQGLFYILDLNRYLPEWVKFGFTAATGQLFELHTIHSWDLSSTLQTNIVAEPSHGKNIKKALAVGLSVGAGSLVVGFGLVFFIWRKTKVDENEGDPLFNEVIDDEFEKGTGPKKFSYRELARATNKFSEREKLGEGGFGGVYRGFLKDLNSFVAVKRVSRGSRQGMKEYASEVKIISRLRHRNIVQLIGWCHEKGELLLVYEFMSNGSLSSHLFREDNLLPWAVRYKITHGLACAVLYLHEEWEQCVIHRDIKSSNIMLDSDFNPKLGDFGLARLVDHRKGAQSTVLAGTIGYLAPECATTGRASKESDVFSFGIVALEIACGRKNISPDAEESKVILVERVWELYGQGKLLEAADPRMQEDYAELQMECLMLVGLWCAYPDKNLRPSIRQAIQVLDFEAPLPALPLQMPVATYNSDPPIFMAASSTSTSLDATISGRGTIESSSNSHNTNSS